MSEWEVVKAVRALVAAAPRSRVHALSDEMYEALYGLVPPLSRFIDTGLADAGYENIMPGLFAPTFVRERDLG